MPDVKERFLNITKDHELSILLDQGLYKHLRLMNPKSSPYWFDITTWPNYLCISGDMGCYTFSRIEDMFDFFRDKKNKLTIEPGYWEGKLQAGAEGRPTEITRRWSQLIFNKAVQNYFDQSIDDLSHEEVIMLQNKVNNEILSCTGKCESMAAIYNFESPHLDFIDFSCNCEELDFHYLWCCYAIVWAIQQYDNLKSEVANAK